MTKAQRPLRSKPLSRVVPYRVARLNAEFVRLWGRICDEHGVTLQQWKIMSTVGSYQPIAASEICRWITSDKASVSRLIRQLTARNLIERRPDAKDARVAVITLTSEGTALYVRIAEAMDAQEARILSHVGSVQTDEFLRTLEELEARTRAAFANIAGPAAAGAAVQEERSDPGPANRQV